MSQQDNPFSSGTSNRNDRKKKTKDRLKNAFGLEDSDYGLNGHDFGVTQAPGSPLRSPHHHHHKKQDHLVANQDTLEAFADDVGSLWCGFGAIPVLEEPPSALVFLRDFVSPSRPCIIRNALLVRDARQQQQNNTSHNSNVSLSLAAAHSFRHVERHDPTDTTTTSSTTLATPLQLSLDDIVDMDPSLEIMADATPDGHGDCVRTVLDHATGKRHRMFVTPEQRTMTLDDFRQQLRAGRREQQKQQQKQQKQEKQQNPKQQKQKQDSPSTKDSKKEDFVDESDGKRIFELKGSRKTPRKKETNLMEEMFASCTPTGASTTGSSLDADNLMNGFLSCNPLNDMGEIFLNLVEERGDQCAGTSEDEIQLGEGEAPTEPPPPPPSVLYYSRQNDCFRNELPSIYQATQHVIPQSLPFAQEAFGTGPPEAVNLWMGDERAVSSMHKDPYENLFYVCSGEKIFTLCPPADAPYLYETDFLSGTFDSQQPPQPTSSSSSSRKKQAKKKFLKKRNWTVKTGYEDAQDDGDISDDDDDIRLNPNDKKHNTQQQHGRDGLAVDIEPIRPGPSLQEEARPAYVRWIEADVSALTDPRYERHQMRNFPLLKYAHPIHQIRVQAGEMLYLPALWFHRVTQSRETVGLNYWYNMNFNSPHWCYFQLLNQLQIKQPTPLPSFSPRSHLDQEHDDGAEKKHGH